MTAIVSVLVTALVLVNIAVVLGSQWRRTVNVAVLRSLRPWMFLANLPVIAAVGLTAVALHQVPWLSWGWYRLLTGTDGNAAVAGPSSSPWLYLPFLALLALVVPFLAMDEELLFREGTGATRSMLVRSVLFGLMHCIVGVSIAIGLALGIAGLWYTHQYRKGDVLRSAAYHCAWNYTVLAAVVAAVIGQAVTA